MSWFSRSEPPVTAVFVVDDVGFIAGWNEGAEQVLGHAAADVVGRSAHHVICGRDASGRRVCHPSCPLHPEDCSLEPRGEVVLFPATATRDTLRITTNVFRVSGTTPDSTLFVHVITSASKAAPRRPRLVSGRQAKTTDRLD